MAHIVLQTSVDVFKMLLLNDLSKVAPVRKIYFRGKHSKFVRKELNKTLLHRAKTFLQQKLRKLNWLIILCKSKKVYTYFFL